MTNDIACHNPEVPFAFEPQYDLWKKEFERYEITEDTLLIGHSTGAGFIIRWSSENRNVKVSKVVLVAPFFDPFGEIKEDFFNFTFDRELVKRSKNGITIFNSTNDDESIHVSVKQLLDNVDNVNYVEFENYGHFCLGNLGTDQFPELLEECLK